jgi:hypothetical protein
MQVTQDLLLRFAFKTDFSVTLCLCLVKVVRCKMINSESKKDKIFSFKLNPQRL